MKLVKSGLKTFGRDVDVIHFWVEYTCGWLIVNQEECLIDESSSSIELIFSCGPALYLDHRW